VARAVKLVRTKRRHGSSSSSGGGGGGGGGSHHHGAQGGDMRPRTHAHSHGDGQQCAHGH
jgi:hypothetical protein